MTIPFACDQEDMLDNLESQVRVDNNIIKVELPSDLEVKLQTDLMLQKRVLEIQTELNEALTPSMEALAILGKDILRSRGVNPDTVFAGPDDVRFALVPMVTEILDSINAEMNKEGFYLKGIIWTDKKDLQQQTGSNNSISITQDLQWGSHCSKKAKALADCFDQGGAATILAGMTGAMAWTKTTGVIIASVCGVAIPTWAAVALTGGGYYAFRVGDCQGKVVRGGYHLVDDRSELERCMEKVRYAPTNPMDVYDHDHCRLVIQRAMHQMMADAKERFGDTLTVAATHEL